MTTEIQRRINDIGNSRSSHQSWNYEYTFDLILRENVNIDSKSRYFYLNQLLENFERPLVSAQIAAMEGFTKEICNPNTLLNKSNVIQVLDILEENMDKGSDSVQKTALSCVASIINKPFANCITPIEKPFYLNKIASKLDCKNKKLWYQAHAALMNVVLTGGGMLTEQKDKYIALLGSHPCPAISKADDHIDYFNCDIQTFKDNNLFNSDARVSDMVNLYRNSVMAITNPKLVSTIATIGYDTEIGFFRK